MLSPFAPVIMPLLMTENGLKKTTNDSEPEDGSEDNKMKSFRNTVLKESNVTPIKDKPVNALLKKRPQSDTSSDIDSDQQLTNKRQKTSENCQKVSSFNSKGEPQIVLNTSGDSSKTYGSGLNLEFMQTNFVSVDHYQTLKDEHEAFKLKFVELAMRINEMEKALKSKNKKRSQSIDVGTKDQRRPSAAMSHMESEVTNVELAKPFFTPKLTNA